MIRTVDVEPSVEANWKVVDTHGLAIPPFDISFCILERGRRAWTAYKAYDNGSHILCRRKHGYSNLNLQLSHRAANGVTKIWTPSLRT